MQRKMSKCNDCKHCPYLVNVGDYEYPEYDCKLLVPEKENDIFLVEDGCNLTKREMGKLDRLLTQADERYGKYMEKFLYAPMTFWQAEKGHRFYDQFNNYLKALRERRKKK